MPYSPGLDMPKGVQRFNIRMDPRDALRMTCVNANCEAERDGWMMAFDTDNAKHRGAIDYIENDSGRVFVSFRARDAAGEIDRRGSEWGVDLLRLRELISRALPDFLIYVFPPHQQCFKRHLDREVHFTAATRERLVKHSPLGFNEAHNEAAYRITELRRRG